MAVGALPGVMFRRCVRPMAVLTVGEAAVVKVNGLPIGYNMAVGALPRVMVRGRVCLVAGLATSEAAVVKVNGSPIGYNMAVGTLPGVMACGRVYLMAGEAVHQPDVAESVSLPIVGAMAVAALPRIMRVGRGVTIAASAQPIMAEPGPRPGVGGVAIAALARIVVEWPVGFVAVQAVGLLLVGKDGPIPGVGGVTVAALPGVMARWGIGLMAGLAIAVVGVVEGDGGPARDAVAALAGSLVMVQGRFLTVAGKAITKAGMVKGNGRPIFGIGVAEGAVARVGGVGFWGLLAVAALALCYSRMVVVDFIPGCCAGVAEGAVTRVMDGRRVWAVAGGARAAPLMIVAGDGPIGGVLMADQAVAGVVGNGRPSLWIVHEEQARPANRRVVCVAGATFQNASMVELVRLPGVGVVTIGAVAGEVLRVGSPEVVGAGGEEVDGDNGRFPRMAIGAHRRSPGVLTVVVAAFAGHLCVAGRQGKGAVVYSRLAQEGDADRLYQAGDGAWRQLGHQLGRVVEPLPGRHTGHQGGDATSLIWLQGSEDDFAAAE